MNVRPLLEKMVMLFAITALQIMSPALQEQFSMTGDQEHSRDHMHKYAANALERLPDDARASDLQLLISTLYQTGDTTNLEQLLNIYFDRDMCPSYVLQYHFNELQGMEQNAVYIGTHEGEMVEIPIEEALTMKKYLQMERYKVLEAVSVSVPKVTPNDLDG